MKSGKKQILKGVRGSVGRGKLHALIGPSGSGKTSLLNVLSGTVPKGSMQLTGFKSVRKDAKTVFVQQEDLLFAQLTVGETLETSVRLNSKDGSISSKDTDDVVDNFLRSLSLSKVKKTAVGNAKTRGVSGGEKKRLSIGDVINRACSHINEQYPYTAVT